MNKSSKMPAHEPHFSPSISPRGLLRLVLLLSPILVLCLPHGLFGTGVSIVEQRMLAILVFAVVFWILEPIPVFATSVVVIFIQLVLVSDSAPWFLRPLNGAAGDSPAGAAAFGKLVAYKELFHSFASPVIMLFLGGFFLSGAATKYSLDKNLARILLKPFGDNVTKVTLGVMAVTAFFSLWMANTPVTAMMLAICSPIVALFERDDPGRAGFLLSIPIASSLGGIGTPVGTPINAIALRYLTGANEIGFGKWMLIAVPYVILMLLFSWWWLGRIFPARRKDIRLEFSATFDRSPKAVVVYVVFPLTILLWLTSAWHEVNIYTIGLVPVAAFLATGVITKADLKKMSWDVLWLIAGGIALGTGLEQTGLTDTIVAVVPFSHLPPFALVTAGALLAALLATIMSHTATANLVVPVLAAIGASHVGLPQVGGMKVLLFAAAIACSLGMALPISTPCNALTFAAGGISNRQMLLGGGVVSVVGFMLLAGVIVAAGSVF